MLGGLRDGDGDGAGDGDARRLLDMLGIDYEFDIVGWELSAWIPCQLCRSSSVVWSTELCIQRLCRANKRCYRLLKVSSTGKSIGKKQCLILIISLHLVFRKIPHSAYTGAFRESACANASWLPALTEL